MRWESCKVSSMDTDYRRGMNTSGSAYEQQDLIVSYQTRLDQQGGDTKSQYLISAGSRFHSLTIDLLNRSTRNSCMDSNMNACRPSHPYASVIKSKHNCVR